MRIELLTDPKKALMFAGAVIAGVIFTVDSNSGETAFNATDPDYEYVPRDEEERPRQSERLFGQSEDADRFDDRDIEGTDVEGFDPTPTDVRATSPIGDDSPRAGSMTAAARPPGIDGPGT